MQWLQRSARSENIRKKYLSRKLREREGKLSSLPHRLQRNPMESMGCPVGCGFQAPPKLF
jgi:hypothetical protein